MISDLRLQEFIHVGKFVRVERCWRADVGQSVIVKRPTDEGMNPDLIARLRLEYSLLTRLAAAKARNVIRPVALLADQNEVALVTEDIGGKALRSYLQEGTLTLQDILSIMHAAALGLADVHRASIIHKDINPNNIIYNAKTRDVRIIDFGIASHLVLEDQAGGVANDIEGTLAYMSPEQTGKVNYTIDYRTDFYSLGATFYELVTRCLPYAEQDSADFAHAILTRLPTHPEVLVPDLPRVVGAIITKLMSKDPKERYQGATSLINDLQRCCLELQQTGTVSDFVIGYGDCSERFEAPQGLFGRQAQIAALMRFYARTSQGERCTLIITGPAGIGKSALVHGFQQQLAPQHPFYAAGKFAKLQRHIPLSGVTQVIAALVDRIFWVPPSVSEGWRRRVQEALGNVGQAVVDLVPSLEKLVGPQKSLVSLGPQETENRLLAVLLRLINALAEKQPLLLFFDDLQWADLGSLKLIRRLAAASTAPGGLLLILAYRHEELPPGHDVLATLQDLQQQGPALDTLTLTPLTREDIGQLLHAATQAPLHDCAPVAAVLHDKTAGSPLFLRALLKNLCRDNVFVFDTDTRRWTWDLPAILAAPVAASAVDVMLKELNRLSHAVRQAIGLAACLGQQFRLLDLCAIGGQPRKDTLALLAVAVQAGLLTPLSSTYRYAADTEEDVGFRFSHDRIQDAGLLQMSAEQAEKVHYTIAQHLLAKHGKPGASEQLFAVIYHINKAAALINSDADSLQAAELNLEAGKYAKRSAAAKLAVDYFQRAAEFAGARAWESRHDLMLDITLELSDSELLLGHYPAVNTHLDAAANHAADASEALDVVARRVQLLRMQGRHNDAIMAGMSALKTIGIKVPRRPQRWRVPVAIWRLRQTLKARSVLDLAKTPELDDPAVSSGLELLAAVCSSTFLVDPLTYALAVLAGAQLIATQGVSRSAPMIFCGLATVFTKMARPGLAKQWWEGCDDLLQRYPDASCYGLILFCSALIKEDFRPPSEFLEALDNAYRRLVEVGNPSDALVVLRQAAQVGMCISVPTWQQRVTAYEAGAALSETKSPAHDIACNAMRLAIDHGFDAPVWFSHQSLAQLAEPRLSERFLLVMDLLMAYLRRDIEQACTFAASISEEVLNTSTNWTCTWVALFTALSLTQQAAETGAKRVASPKLLAHALRHLRGLQGALSHLVFLVEAEVAALEGATRKAARLYDAATQQLSKCGYMLFSAAAYECAGRYYNRHDLKIPASAYLSKAWRAYKTWGGAPKGEQLWQEFSLLLDGALSAASQAEASSVKLQASSVRASSASGRIASMELPLIVRACLAISSEVTVARVVEKILDATIKYAGATRAALFAIQDGKLTCVAAMLADSSAWPQDLLNYVVRSAETVVIDEPRSDTRFAENYFQQTNARALCCAPIVYQGEAKGVIYLENTSTPGVFDPQRLVTVGLLVSQAAIALENARIVANLDNVVAERTAQVEIANRRIVQMERQQTEATMAGGFAHEIRNSLAGACYMLAAAHPVDGPQASHGTLSQRFDHGLHELKLWAAEMRMSAPQQGRFDALLLHLKDTHSGLSEIHETIYADLQRALRVAERILEYAQIGQTLPADAQTNLEPLLHEILADFQDQLATDGILAELSVDKALTVPMQKDHIAIICRNALSNARDALHGRADGQARKIQIAAQTQDNSVMLAVHDTGVGMNAATQARLFEPFFSTKGAHGMGLGLGLSRKLARVYGGEIEVASELGQGTTFRLKIPLA